MEVQLCLPVIHKIKWQGTDCIQEKYRYDLQTGAFKDSAINVVVTVMNVPIKNVTPHDPNTTVSKCINSGDILP